MQRVIESVTVVTKTSRGAVLARAGVGVRAASVAKFGQARRLMAALTVFVGVGAVLAPVPALAWHGHGRVGVVIGGPVFSYGYPYYGGYGAGYGYGYPYYGPYPYYPPAVVSAPAAPPVYVEQPTTAAPQAAAEGGFWYYCHDPAGYYPSVKTCARGWQKVAPLPAQ